MEFLPSTHDKPVNRQYGSRYASHGKQLCLVLASAVLLTACNGDGDNSFDTLERLSNNSTQAESQEIMHPAGLQHNITSLFGEAHDEPVPINNNETLPSVIQRLSKH